VTGLWIWGGGHWSARRPRRPLTRQSRPIAPTDRDPYLEGLWCARGARVHPLPESIEDLSKAPARCSVILVELSELLRADRTASVCDALAMLDRLWIAPAADLLARGALRSLAVIANDDVSFSGGTMG